MLLIGIRAPPTILGSHGSIKDGVFWKLEKRIRARERNPKIMKGAERSWNKKNQQALMSGAVSGESENGDDTDIGLDL